MSDSKAVTKRETEETKFQSFADSLFAQAHTPEERALVFGQLKEYRQSQLIRRAAAVIAEQTWGRDASPAQQAALARYALETGTDPVRHWTFIAGSPYDRAELWMDLVAAEPTFLRDESVLIHSDGRLNEAKAAHRKALRAEHGVPEEVKGAAIVMLYFSDRGPFQGVNWAGSYGHKKDPIGDAEPTKTALTRAYRKAAKKAVPLWFKSHPLFDQFDQLKEQARGAMAAGDIRDENAVEFEAQPGLTIRMSGPGIGSPPLAHGSDGAYAEPSDEEIRREEQQLDL